jgi:hypothetical protein
MTLADIASTVRFLTNSDSTSYTDAQLLINLNTWYQKIVTMIFESQDESDFDDARNTDYPIETTPMVASQRDYSIPVSNAVLKIKRVDLTYDGTNYYRAYPIDDGSVSTDMGANLANTDQDFVKQNPRYDVKYNSVFIYPAPTAADVSAGGSIRIEWERNVTPFTSAELTAGTVVPGFDAPFHPMLVQGAAYDYAFARQLPQLQQLQASLVDWEARLRQHYSHKVIDRTLQMKSGYDDSYGR